MIMTNTWDDYLEMESKYEESFVNYCSQNGVNLQLSNFQDIEKWMKEFPDPIEAAKSYLRLNLSKVNAV